MFELLSAGPREQVSKRFNLFRFPQPILEKSSQPIAALGITEQMSQ